MSNKLNGVFKRSKNTGIKGTLGRMVNVSVNTPSKVNRQTNAPLCTRYTKNGFDYNKWSLPTVAQLPGGQQYLLDGDHRRHMFKEFHPEETEMPVWLIEVKSEEEFHRLFVEINSTHRKNVNGDEAFIHMVHAGDEKAIKLKEQLVACGVSVNGSPEVGGVQGALKSKHVKINSFKRALKIGDEASVGKAVAIIEEAWDEERYPLWSDKVHGELMQAFAAIYRNYKCLSNGSDYQADFENWVGTILSANPPNEVASDYKKKGGAKQHKQGYCIALAIISEFRKCHMHGAITDVKKRQSSLPPKNIKRHLTC